MKKGFTLVELLVVIVIIGALATLVLPGLLANYNKGINKIMKTQENLINDAAALAIQDHCNNPMSTEMKATCKYDSENNKGLLRQGKGDVDRDGTSDTFYYVCVKDLRREGYYDNELAHENRRCFGATYFKRDNNKFVNPKTLVYCYKDDYIGSDDDSYVTDSKVPSSLFQGCYEAPDEL